MKSKEEIIKIIPHRDPFLMIDGAEIIESEKSAKGFKKLTGNEDFLRGHFPDEPVMPGILIIESMAQLGAFLILSIEKYHGKKVYFTSIDNAKFRRKVVPGDTLELYVELISFRHSIGRGAARAEINGETVCTAELGFAIA
ncbi:3-hydroxyacyl-ACP dehydratase FabZ [bacterium]|nr:3-hydroxyacyl-ACP dehydratase FabZ [bacterium]